MPNFDYLETGTKNFIEELLAQGGKPLYQLSVEEAREVLNSVQKDGPKLPAKIEDLTIQTEKGPVSIRIVRPENISGPLPVAMYFHGGGWILGNKETHDRLIREIAVGAQIAIVFVNYTPSPEAQYPKSIEEAYAATVYVAAHGKELNLDTSRLAVVGDSVGGNMATVVTLLAKERRGPKIAYQVLFYPVTDANFNTPSYKQFAEGPWLTKPAMEWFWNAYAPDVESREQPTASPLQASLEQLRGLPPALIITDENDVLRDEGEAYAHKLIQAGVSVTAIRYVGTIHDFVLLNALKDTPAACGAIELANIYLSEVLKTRTLSAV